MGPEPETSGSWTPPVVTEVSEWWRRGCTRPCSLLSSSSALPLQRAPPRGTTAGTRRPVAADEAAGVQEDRDRAPGEEDLPPGDHPGGAYGAGRGKLVVTFHRPPFQLVCEQTRDQEAPGGGFWPVQVDSKSLARFNVRDILFHSEHFVCSVLLFVKDFYVFVFSLRWTIKIHTSALLICVCVGGLGWGGIGSNSSHTQ